MPYPKMSIIHSLFIRPIRLSLHYWCLSLHADFHALSLLHFPLPHFQHALANFGLLPWCVDLYRISWFVKHCGSCAASMSAGGGVLDLSASTLVCQKRSRFKGRRARYWRRLEYHEAVASVVFRRRDELYSRLTSRLDCRHYPSNQGLDRRRRMVMCHN